MPRGRQIFVMRFNITLPAYNEEDRITDCVQRVLQCVEAQGWNCEVVIAENGSMDQTRAIAEELAAECRKDRSRMLDTPVTLRAVHLDQAGRGGALREAWLASDADVLSYMDIDLSTDLAHLPELIGTVAEDHADLAIGSRLLPGSQTTRGWKREFLSRGYNRLLHAALGLQVADAQCGFKAITRRAAQALLPWVRDDGWFFDTELLVLAQRSGWRVAELPVRWVEDTDSTVRLLPTVSRDLKGIWRLRRELRRDNWPPEACRAAHHELSPFATANPPGE